MLERCERSGSSSSERSEALLKDPTSKGLITGAIEVDSVSAQAVAEGFGDTSQRAVEKRIKPQAMSYEVTRPTGEEGLDLAFSFALIVIRKCPQACIVER